MMVAALIDYNGGGLLPAEAKGKWLKLRLLDGDDHVARKRFRDDWEPSRCHF